MHKADAKTNSREINEPFHAFLGCILYVSATIG